MTNFVSNAINHVDFDKVIEIKMKKENGKVHTSVFNTGVPIPEADIDKIWIKFYKVDKARSENTAEAESAFLLSRRLWTPCIRNLA